MTGVCHQPFDTECKNSIAAAMAVTYRSFVHIKAKSCFSEKGIPNRTIQLFPDSRLIPKRPKLEFPANQPAKGHHFVSKSIITRFLASIQHHVVSKRLLWFLSVISLCFKAVALVSVKHDLVSVNYIIMVQSGRFGFRQACFDFCQLCHYVSKRSLRSLWFLSIDGSFPTPPLWTTGWLF